MSLSDTQVNCRLLHTILDKKHNFVHRHSAGFYQYLVLLLSGFHSLLIPSPFSVQAFFLLSLSGYFAANTGWCVSKCVLTFDFLSHAICSLQMRHTPTSPQMQIDPSIPVGMNSKHFSFLFHHLAFTIMVIFNLAS